MQNADLNLDILITNWLAAWTGNQPQKLIDFYSEGIIYIDPVHPRGIEDKSELLSYFEKLLAKNPYWRWLAKEIFPTDKGCILKWLAKIPVGEEMLELNGLDIIEVQNGKITRNEIYFDRTEWLEILVKEKAKAGRNA